MINGLLKYKFTKDDVDKFITFLPSRTSFIRKEGEDFIMDASTTLLLKSKFAMDEKIRVAYDYNSFDEFLDSRLVPYYKIYKFVTGGVKDSIDIYRTPYDVDFTNDLIIKPFKKSLPKDHGKPTVVEYYEKKYFNQLGQVVYENLICKIDFDLKYSGAGFIYQKDAVLKWCLSDDTCDVNNTKNLGEIYDFVLDNEKIIKEGVTRRRSIIDTMQLPALTFLTALFPDKTQQEVLIIGRDFMNDYKMVFDAFVYSSETITDPEDPNYGKKEVVVTLENETRYAWLDTEVDIGFGLITPRAFMIGQLSI